MIRQVAPGIYRGPRLRPAEYRELQARGVRTVINLEDDEPSVEADRAECKSRGIIFINKPMSEWLPASAQRLSDAAMTIQAASGAHPAVYVHCRRGIDRTGQVIAAWRIRYGGWTFDQAYQEQISFGHPELYNLLGWRWTLSRIEPL